MSIQPSQVNMQDQSSGRKLPSRDQTDATFDDGYVNFIMYCNPAVPSDTDTTELRKTFRSPPKSDGKTFNPYTLFELIRKLELKELKTWAQLALELGVEPPALEKGQSAQKIQQYAVRLKRWMHAMHVDAFFEYLLNKSHVYWTRIPRADDSLLEHSRDGVVADEDLALRALMPEMKPKRGRRKADDRDADSDLSRSPAQRPRLHSPALSEDFTLSKSSLHGTPATAQATSQPSFPCNSSISTHGLGGFNSPPSNAAVSFSNEPNRWTSQEHETPFSAFPHSDYPHSAFPQSTIYPQSAMLPRGANPFSFENEPQSAITPSKGRMRRRNGPAVSSAWLSNSGTTSGKLRGRPPSNRNVSDGQFSTFPAQPSNAPVINLRDPTPTQTPVVDRPKDGETAFSFNPTDTQRARASRASLHHLQVPERVGAPVRLATPPPIVPTPTSTTNRSPKLFDSLMASETPGFMSPYEAMAAAELSRSRSAGPTLGNNQGALPKRSPVQSQTNSQWDKPALEAPKSIPVVKTASEAEDWKNCDGVELAISHLILTADWYDVDGLPTQRCTIKEAMLIQKQLIVDMCNEAPTKELFLLSLCAIVGATALLTSLKMRRFEKNKRTTKFGIRWAMKFGAVEGGYVKNIELSEAALGPENERQVGDEWDAAKEVADEWTEGPVGENLSSDVAAESNGIARLEKRYVEMTKAMADKDRKLREMRSEILGVLLRHNIQS